MVSFPTPEENSIDISIRILFSLFLLKCLFPPCTGQDDLWSLLHWGSFIPLWITCHCFWNSAMLLSNVRLILPPTFNEWPNDFLNVIIWLKDEMHLILFLLSLAFFHFAHLWGQLYSCIHVCVFLISSFPLPPFHCVFVPLFVSLRCVPLVSLLWFQLVFLFPCDRWWNTCGAEV